MPISSAAIKSKIDAVREQIGRTVTFYTPIGSTDFTASGFYDPVSYTGFIPQLEATEVLARVHWATDERITMSPGGKWYVGDCSLTIDPSYHGLAQETLKENGYIIVDNKKVRVTEIDPWGAPTVNRIRLICKAEGTQPEA